MSLGLRHAPLALRRRGGGIEAQHLVDQLEVPIVVQQPLIGGDLGVHPHPETDVRLERRRMGERIGFVRGGRKAESRRDEQQAKRRNPYAMRSGIHRGDERARQLHRAVIYPHFESPQFRQVMQPSIITTAAVLHFEHSCAPSGKCDLENASVCLVRASNSARFSSTSFC